MRKWNFLGFIVLCLFLSNNAHAQWNFWHQLVNSNYKQVPTNGLLYHYKLNSDLTDSTSGNHLSLSTGTQSFSTSVKKFSTGSLYLNGSTCYRSNSVVNGSLTGAGSRTISAWIYLLSNTPDASGLVGWGDTTVNTGLLFYLVPRIENKDQWGIWGWAKDLNSGIASSSYFNSWHHIVAMYNGSTEYLYIDGVLKGSSVQALSTNQHQLRIGCSPSGNTTAYIQNVRIYNRSLSDAEIGLLYNER